LTDYILKQLQTVPPEKLKVNFPTSTLKKFASEFIFKSWNQIKSNEAELISSGWEKVKENVEF